MSVGGRDVDRVHVVQQLGAAVAVLEQPAQQIERVQTDEVDAFIVGHLREPRSELLGRLEQRLVIVTQQVDGVQQMRRFVADLLEQAIVALGARDVLLEDGLQTLDGCGEALRPLGRVVAGRRGQTALHCEDRVVQAVAADAHRIELRAVAGLDLLGLIRHALIPSRPARASTLERSTRGPGASILGLVIQLRIISPNDLTPTIVSLLRDEHGATNLTVHADAAIEPAGDLLIVDVARERGNAVVEKLLELRLDERGSISLVSLEASASRVAATAEALAVGHGWDAIVWQQLDESARNDSARSVTYFVLMVLAALIATVGVLVDSAVLIIGAMIVGPEYGPLNAISVAIYRKRAYGVRAAIKLALGLVFAVVGAAVATEIFRLIDQVPADFETSDRFFTSFVTEPNVFSFVVALVAGIVGTIALAQGRQTALAGVLVSVTTIPAAAALGVDLVFGDWSDAGGAAAQLGINLVSIVFGAVATLIAHDRAWRRAHGAPLIRRAL